jgi:hypothetical protein
LALLRSLYSCNNCAPGPRQEVIVAKSKAKSDQKKKIPEDKIPENKIEDLKRRAEELSGEPMEIGTLDDCSAETEEEF